MPYQKDRLANNTSTPLHGIKILVAEDHVFNQEIITDILENAGAAVCIAQNGMEALNLMKQKPFDCVLLDVQMPVMDGFQTIERIRADPTLAMTPVIAMTASASNEDRCRCLSAGMNDFIEKPFEPARLHHMITGLTQITVTHALPRAAKKPIDLSVLTNWIGDDKIKLQKFTGSFLDSAHLDLIEINAALEIKDFVALTTLAHHISSPARMVGASDFYELSKQLEITSRTICDTGVAHNLISQMHVALEQIAEIVSQELA
ncbi:response regulator [Gallionella capsiferriformans]|jgi:CheY-like chemotaxis protein|uniref:Response regulator receiver and Hpt phospho transfer protein n=1 Tax=Gallionella capsiferriformans (strain ES-2) TaxID=395494 RepID=D9SGL0_GALCS|nr:response regulator [Gallionella capsiferriformans]ADL55657.1 response regulator receiver and Hpt phospho transfer protein [Gallionella capsiferriformans ES-2]